MSQQIFSQRLMSTVESIKLSPNNNILPRDFRMCPQSIQLDPNEPVLMNQLSSLINLKQHSNCIGKINKKSQVLRRNTQDLYKWYELCEHKRNLIIEKEKLESLKNASIRRNIKLSESRSSNKDVFQRLYQKPSRPSDTSAISVKKSKKSDMAPYFTKSMSKEQLEAYQLSQGGTPIKQSTIENTHSQSQQWKPCLPNMLYFDQERQGSFKAMKPNIQAPVIDLTGEISRSQESSKKFTQTEALNVVDRYKSYQDNRLHTWQLKKVTKLHQQQEINHQKDLQECTFHPRLINRDYSESPNRTSKERATYSELFSKKISQNEYR